MSNIFWVWLFLKIIFTFDDGKYPMYKYIISESDHVKKKPPKASLKTYWLKTKNIVRYWKVPVAVSWKVEIT